MPLPAPPSTTFVTHLRDHVQRQPDEMAFVFLKNGETEAGQLSYHQVDERARAIATRLQASLSVGDRVLLVYPYEAGLAFISAFLGCLYAGMVAVPCAAPRNRSGWLDLGDRLQSSAAKLVLSTQALLPKVLAQLSSTAAAPLLPQLQSLATDAIAPSSAPWTPPDLTPETLAFLQYTSGSTGKPKGVMVTHHAILQNQRMIQAAFGHGSHTMVVGWLPLFHDMGLIGNVLQLLYLGRGCVLMSPIDFVQKPVRWLQAISRYRATTSGGPNFAYDLLCNRVTESQRAALDLSSWEVAFSGAEPVLLDTIERFSRQFADCGFRHTAFYPCYGMAEATLLISGGQAGQGIQTCTVEREALEQNRVVPQGSTAPGIPASASSESASSESASSESASSESASSESASSESASPESPLGRTLISCGTPWLDGRIVIADPERETRCAPDQVGEIWVAGSGLGSGYWGQTELSDRTFRATLQDTGETPFLRTGDLGFWHDGQLYITGRLHDVLVFWGLNHYPQHIEKTVEDCHPGFRANSAAAFAVEVEGDRRLVVAQEVERSFCRRLTLEEVVEPLRWQIFQEHFVDLYGLVLLKPGALPRTSSGKVQRRRCPALFLAQDWEHLGEWRSPNPHPPDLTTLIEHYLNPLTHLQRLSNQTTGRLKRLLSHAKP